MESNPVAPSGLFGSGVLVGEGAIVVVVVGANVVVAVDIRVGVGEHAPNNMTSMVVDVKI